MSSTPARLGGFRALALGFRTLRRNRALVAVALGSEGALAACRALLLLGGAAAVAHHFLLGLGQDEGSPAAALDGAFDAALSPALWLPLLGAWLALELLGAVLRAFYLGGAVVDASARLLQPDRAALPLVPSALAVLPRAVVASLWIALLEGIAGLVRLVLAACTVVVVVHGISSHAGGLGVALAGALGITLTVLGALLLALFARAYRVVALRRLEVAAHTAMWDAGTLLGTRLGTLLLVEVLGFALLVGGSLMAAGPGGLAAALGVRHLVLGLGLRVAAATLVAAWAAGVELSLLGALCAIDLDAAGELPQPPAPSAPVVLEAVAIAEPVLVAQAIDPKPSLH